MEHVLKLVNKEIDHQYPTAGCGAGLYRYCKRVFMFRPIGRPVEIDIVRGQSRRVLMIVPEEAVE